MRLFFAKMFATAAFGFFIIGVGSWISVCSDPQFLDPKPLIIVLSSAVFLVLAIFLYRKTAE